MYPARLDFAIASIATDSTDLAAALHLASDAANARGDSDMRRLLRLLARQAETTTETAERLLAELGEAKRRRVAQ